AAAWLLPAQFGKIEYAPLVDQVRGSGVAPKHLITVGADPLPGTVSFEALLREGTTGAGGHELLEALRPDPREVCHLMPTGGTTGLPKLVPRTHNDYLCNAEFRARAWERSPQDTALVATPLTHNMALEVLLFPTLLTGGRLVILPSTDAEGILGAISQERVTTTILVPAQLVDLVAVPEIERYDRRTLGSLAGAGAKVPAELVRKVRERFGVLFFNVFGMAEGPCAMTRPEDPPEVVEQTVGYPICPYDEFRILDDEGRPLPAGEEGELAARGPGVFCGYYNDVAKNREVFTEEGFFRTGDLARLDGAGRLIIAGRKKDVLIRGGENISAAEVEELLMVHPDVAHAAVVGLPDPRLGERICAYVQPVPGTRPTLEALRRFLGERGVSVLFHPERLELLEALPLTNVGKVDKTALRADLEARLRQEQQA
ncbi:MAG: AMP-binding protein, partial [Deltaproteobacteria bacterium]|nr:AMP-binding protein [Deltaproteobacteria bacterium]